MSYQSLKINGSSMEQLFKRGVNLKKIQNSMDDLENLLHKEDHANESMQRLSQALRDINEEVNLMKNMIQNNNK